MNARKFTAKDAEFQAKLQGLQAEQKTLNRRTKTGRERFQQITAEFFATKAEWLKVCGPTHSF